MKSKVLNSAASDLNKIIKFLAKRDVDLLEKQSLNAAHNLDKVDLIILLGNSIPYSLKVTANAYINKIADKIMIVGGIGHSTDYLRDNVSKHPIFSDTPVLGRSEADIFKDILIQHFSVDESSILLENKSLNCGSNAVEALKILKEHAMYPKSIILIQDPTMQLRSYASFLKAWSFEKSTAKFINYAPFVPLVEESFGKLSFVNTEVDGLWDMERFLSLVLGEIPRLLDNEHGYGPRGKGFIEHIDIPTDILSAYENLRKGLSEFCNR